MTTEIKNVLARLLGFAQGRGNVSTPRQISGSRADSGRGVNSLSHFPKTAQRLPQVRTQHHQITRS